MDERCTEIISVIKKKGRMTFGDLKKKLVVRDKSIQPTYSEATLSKHLKELNNKEIEINFDKETQKRFYEIKRSTKSKPKLNAKREVEKIYKKKVTNKKATVKYINEDLLNNIIEKFNSTNSMEIRKIIIGNDLLPQIINSPVNSSKFLAFLYSCIINNDDTELISQLAEAIWHIEKYAIKFNIKNVKEEFQKIKNDENLKSKLEGIILSKNQKIINPRYDASRFLILLDPERSLNVLLDALQNAPQFIDDSGYADLISEAHANSKIEIKETITACRKILETNYDEWRKNVARIVISKL